MTPSQSRVPSGRRNPHSAFRNGKGFAGREMIEAGQLASLRAMLAEVVPNNRFYAQKLAEAGLSAEIAGLEEFRACFPFTVTGELAEDQRRHPPYGTNLTYPLDSYTRFSQTSGTTGNPIRWLDTTESWSWMVDNWVQVLQASGLCPGDRIFFAFSFGPFLGFWTAFEAGIRMGCMCLPGGGMSSVARVRSILDNRATALCCTPTYALRLGEVALENGIDLADGQVRTIVVAGEPGAGIPATRDRIEQLWPGAQLKDHHGMTEIGPVTFECPSRCGVLHVMESRFIAEVVHPESGGHVPPGERGELVLTNLGRLGSPLIRYRTGDLVQRAARLPCECGRWDLALEGGILGRTDDMVVIRGVNLYPSAFEEVVRRFERVAEYQVEISRVGAMREVRVQLEPEPDCPDGAALCREVETALRAAWNLRIPVSLAAPGSLPRFEMKSRRWIRLDVE
jgi:phenylacetate-CoA ligase